MSSTENATAKSETVTCPNCGAESSDLEWCDACGSQLNPPSASIAWLEVGSVFAFTGESDEKKRLARVVDLTEVYSTRRVGIAQVCPEGMEGRFFSREELSRHGFKAPDEEAELAESSSDAETCEFPTMSGESVLFEETLNEPSLQPTHLPEEVLDLVYTPFARMKRGPERSLEVFESPEGHPLQEYLEGLERLLTLEEAAGVALLLMDAVERVHASGLLHFQICPWTIRVITPEESEEPIEEASTPSVDELRLVFEGIRGFYKAEEEIRSHPVIMGFSPPEFFGRSQGPLDHHADIFAIGMLFYYLLAGGPPPSGSLTRNTPCLPLRAFRFAMPPGLQPFIDGCTHPEPSERFETVAETRKGLLAALDVAHRRDANRRSEAQQRLSFYCAVDRHIGIGKGRRSPINQDSVFMGHDPDLNLALIAVGDGVSTASFGSGDIASNLLIEACSDSWSKRHDLKQQLVAYARAEAEADDPIALEATLPDGIDVASLSEEERALDPEATLDSNELLAIPDADVEAPAAGEETLDSEDSELPEQKAGDAEGDEPNPTLDESHTPPERELLRGRIGLTGNRSAPPLLETPAAQFIRDVLTDANDSISAHINERFAPFNGPVHEVMGTTSITAILHDDLITLSSLGDSRAYLLRNGHMERLTRDHNLTTLRMIEGFSADESLLLPHGKALARCLGTFQVTQGRLKAIKPEPDLVTFRLMAGDTILLTTDGLIDFGGPTEAAAERNIQTILEAEEIPSIACLKLIVLANEGGGEDNIGMSVIRVTERKDGAGGFRGALVQAFPPTALLRSNA
ncbi:MAG: hypothetical protein CMH57_06040 [Myxococcales bacterium]|nr:hypothetical protein [Myxococcales bacterium]